MNTTLPPAGRHPRRISITSPSFTLSRLRWVQPLATAGLLVTWLGVAAPATEGALIARYSFESLAGGLVTDSSGLGNDGILHGSLAPDAGPSGMAAHFQGGGYIEIPASAGIDLGAGCQMTLIFSLKRDNALAGCYQRGVPELNLFSKLDNRPEADADSGFHFLIANNSPSFYFPKGLGNQRHIEPVSPLSDWSQVVLIKDDEEWTLYQDGQPLPRFDQAMGKPGVWGLGDPFTNGDFEPMNGAPMLIGAALDFNRGGIPADLFKGWMDDISVYDEALTPDELAGLGLAVSAGAPLNDYTDLLGEAPDALTSWPWDPGAVRCGDEPCPCPDTLPVWSAWLALMAPCLWRLRVTRRSTPTPPSNLCAQGR